MITFQMGDIVFDEDLIAEAIRRAEARGGRRIGFLTRDAAQRSLVDAPGTSSPGDPPHSHDGTLRRFMLYAWSAASRSVVIGPKLLKKKSRDAASALEHGGFSEDTKGRSQRVAARPFMRPALERTLARSMSDAFLNSVSR